MRAAWLIVRRFVSERLPSYLLGQRGAEVFFIVLAYRPVIDFASACCSGIVTATVTTTTPNNANATTIAILLLTYLLIFSYESFMFVNPEEPFSFKYLKKGKEICFYMVKSSVILQSGLPKMSPIARHIQRCAA
jgi:hypothetical protein